MSDKPNYLASLPKDLTSGLVVFLVALPLCLGIALASNAPLISGLVAGVVGGLVVSWLSGSHTSVSGPAAGLTAIVVAQIEKLGTFETFLVAVILAGIIQIVMGVLKAGSLAAFFPSSVIKGLLAAIGVILILKQIPHLFGHDPDWLGDLSFRQLDGQNTFTEITGIAYDLHLGAMIIGLMSLALLMVWDRSPLKKLPVPSALVVVVLSVGMVMALDAMAESSIWRVGITHLVQVPDSGSIAGQVKSLHFPDVKALANPAVYLAAITIAIVATLETLLNLEAVDKLDKFQRVSPPNRELVAQGVGNMTSGLLGGLPLTSVIVRSSVNINSGGRTRMSAFIHGVLLLTTVVFFPALLNRIPLACLAAILMVTGFKLANPALFKQMWSEGRNQFIPFVVTLSAIVLTDLLIGIIIGMMVATGFVLGSNLRRPLRRVEEKHVNGDVTRIILANQVSFLNRAALMIGLNELPEGRHLVLDARTTDYIDPDVLDLIRDFEHDSAPARGIQVSLLGFKDHYDREDQILFEDYATRDLQERSTPAEILELLKSGNERFRKGQQVLRASPRKIGLTAAAQYPLAVVLACMDSRVATEMVFDLGLGDIFSVRVAGNTAGPKELGSMEYGCAVAGAKVLVVLGHTRCGAVTAAVNMVKEQDKPASPIKCENLHAVTDSIIEVIAAGNQVAPAEAEKMEDHVNHVAALNTRHVVELIPRQSQALRELVEAGKLLIVGGMYDVQTGEVQFIDGPDLTSSNPKVQGSELI